jgi:hypothetical protein
VRTVDSEGLEASFITTGNRSGTKIGGDAAPTLLDLNIGISTHPSFGVCKSPVDQPVDDVEWNLGGINIGKADKLVARFNRNGVPENENKDRCVFDDYTLRIVFEFDVVENGDGSRVYTPTPIGSARVVIIHYAETGKGKNRESHHEPTKGEALEVGLGVTDASITITPQ